MRSRRARPGRAQAGCGGFTLVEVLVALAIVAIALMAAMRAAAQGTASLDLLRGHLLAGWVADNRLAEHRARGDWLPLGTQQGSVREGGIAFAWREEVVATPNAAFRRVDVFVFASTASPASAERGHALAHVTGFVAHPPEAPR